MHKITLIDDDTELCSALEEYFISEGFEVRTCFDGKSGLETVSAEESDLVILDVCLPDRSGFELLTELRATSNMPVLILTGRRDEIDKVVGLEMGADDYLIKPINLRELVARVRALIRRYGLNLSVSPKESKVMTAGDLSLCTGTRKVQVQGRPVQLTHVEFTILQMLLMAEGNLVSREDISLTALNRELTPFDRSIDVHVSNLRRKLGPSSDGGGRITTIRGAGYMYTDIATEEVDTESNDKK